MSLFVMALFWCCTNIVYRHHQHPGETSTCTTPEGGRKGSQREHTSTELTTTNTRPTDATTDATTTTLTATTGHTDVTQPTFESYNNDNN